MAAGGGGGGGGGVSYLLKTVKRLYSFSVSCSSISTASSLSCAFLFAALLCFPSQAQ
uniref:Uncharacterized protein n=1 Tax=Rhizophora mucronata TaxID=61149 RepID=A0A2P2JPT6_RHIMU